MLLAGPACAVGDEPGRYTMSPTDGGVIRLDRETGTMSFCTGKAGEWSCKLLPDSESDMRKRIEELEGEKRSLEAERNLAEREGPEPPAHEPPAHEPPFGDTAPPAPPGNLAIPNEKDVDKLFDYVEGMVKKFKERIERLEREAKKDPEIPL
jgi:hypothetical protein